MARLREHAHPDTLNAVNHALAAKRARDALETRVQQLEAEHAAFDRKLRAVERAVRWLPDKQRSRTRRRLRALGLHQQPGTLAASTRCSTTPRKGARG